MTGIVTLKQLCDDLKTDPKEARERLRKALKDQKTFAELAKGRKARTPWQRVKGSAAHKDAIDDREVWARRPAAEAGTRSTGKTGMMLIFSTTNEAPKINAPSDKHGRSVCDLAQVGERSKNRTCGKQCGKPGIAGPVWGLSHW